MPIAEVRCSSGERFFASVLALVPVILLGVLFPWSRLPAGDPWKLATILGYEVVLLLHILNSFRFVLRLDEDAVVHRDLFTRVIPADQVRSIRVTSTPKLLRRFPRLKVEIVGEHRRIRVEWRRRKLEPMVEALRSKFPDQVEFIPGVPEESPEPGPAPERPPLSKAGRVPI